jgi:hypothetical protein
MKDIQKIKEFFSKPLEESLTGGYPHTKTSGENFEKITITEPIDDATKSKMIKNFRAAGWDAKPNNGGGITAIKKSIMEGNKEYFKPSIRKDKSNPNFLYVDIAYPEGSDILSVGGSKTMGGQDRESGAAKALSMGNAIVKKLQAKYNIEDIEVKDLKNGKVEVFAVSDDFTKIASPSLDEAKTAIDMAKKQLDQLGVKYEMSSNKFKPFRAIYKPIGESDDWYDKFDEIVYLFNLGSAVKQSMGEAKFMSGMLSGKDFINAKLSKYPKAKAKVNQLIDMIGESKFTIEMAEWIFDFFNNAHFESPINEAKEEGSYEVVWTDRDYKKNSKVFKNDPKGAPDNAKKKAEAFKKALEDKDKKSKDGLYRSIDLNEASKEEETKFHKKLDKLVHSTFGKRKDELEEAVNLKSSKLSSAEYQKAKKLKDFKASDWKWNADEDLYNKVNEGVGSDLDEPYFIEISLRDARIAMDMFDDKYRRSNIKMHGSNVYAANTPEDIYDLYYDFKNQDIEVLDYNVDGDLDEATDYMKRRKAQDDYAVSKKDKPTKSYNPKPSGKTDYMKSREKELAETILTKLKK